MLNAKLDKLLLLAAVCSCCFAYDAAAEGGLAASFSTNTVKEVNLYAANCWRWDCTLSALFAPEISTDNLAAVTITNTGTQALSVTPKFIPTNGLAIGVGGQGVLEPPLPVKLNPGETGTIKVAISNSALSAGKYTGSLMLTAPGANTINIPVKISTRDSVFFAIVVAALGIGVGRVSQIVYDPKMLAKVRLYDWVLELKKSAAIIRNAEVKNGFQRRLEDLSNELSARMGNADDIAPKIEAIAHEIQQALLQNEATAAAASLSQLQTVKLGIVLRWFGGFTPLPLRGVYKWILPTFVFVIWVSLTIVFVLQQYGGSGTAETFGAGGFADYAPLFLAGVATDAIANGLRSVKLVAG